MDRKALLAKIEAFLQQPEATAQALLDMLQEQQGGVGLVPRILSRRPEAFVPAAVQSRALYQNPRAIDAKTAELAAVAASAALMCEHCLEAHMRAAQRKGASQDEILDVILVAGAIAESSTLSVALRKFRQMERKLEQ